MTAIPIEQAQADLAKVIHALAPGEEVVITENDKPVAKLIAAEVPPTARPGPGLWKGKATILTEDDEHLQDFTEYMP